MTARRDDVGVDADGRECDDAIRRDLIDLLGESSVATLLDKLSAQIEARLSDDRLNTADRPTIASAAHATVSAAGMLGFTRFATLCAALEEACHDGLPLDPIRAKVRSARDRAVAEIAAGRPGAAR